MICDEPTSALDPIGRKELLDILLSVKDQTTVLFSTHILSDVERICTDIAFLNEGKICLCGKLSDIKAKYRADEYLLEFEAQKDTELFLERFTDLKKDGDRRLRMSEKQTKVYEIMKFIIDNNISLLKIERLEPSIESLFMEVIGR